jgi:hypothetical protein
MKQPKRRYVVSNRIGRIEYISFTDIFEKLLDAQDVVSERGTIYRLVEVRGKRERKR